MKITIRRDDGPGEIWESVLIDSNKATHEVYKQLQRVLRDLVDPMSDKYTESFPAGKP